MVIVMMALTMKDLDGIAGLLGLARKAGKVALGSNAAETALRQGKIHALIFAGDASRVTTEELAKLASKNRVPSFYLSSKDELGHLMGRTTLSILGIVDRSFAIAVARQLEESQQQQ